VIVEIVLSSINFHDELLLHAHEIDDVAGTWRLAPKVKTTRTP